MKKFIIILSLLFTMPAMAEVDLTPSFSDGGKIMVVGAASDIKNFTNEFQQKQLVPDYVPIEVRVGKAVMGAFGKVSEVLDRSLFHFINIFLIALFAFWLMGEAYQLFVSTGSTQKLFESVVKKAVLIAIWLWVLSHQPAEILMFIIGPIITFGSYVGDVILNSVANVIGAQLPDTCGAIREFMANSTTSNAVMSNPHMAELMCLPTRLSGFFTTAIAAGFKWMWAGLGTSALTFFGGLAFVIIFTINLWRFTLMALGVMVDLFLGVMMLPFTAIKECFSGGTSYKGMAGGLFNKFAEMFAGESLSAQIGRFIKAVVYFVALSVVIALCYAILSGAITMDLASNVPSIEGGNFIVVLLTGLFVMYLAGTAKKLAEQVGGKIDDSFGSQKIGNDVKNLWNSTKSLGANIAKIIKDAKKP